MTLTVDDDAAGDFLAQDKQGTQTVVIGANRTTATLTLATTPDSNDEPDGVVTATLVDKDGYRTGSPDKATVAVSDDDATSVMLATPDNAAAEGDASDGAEIALALDRGLVNGEVLAVPLMFAGGAPGQLFTLACPQAPPAGVSCQDLGTANPKVTFTGPASGASAVSVTLSLAAEDDADTDSETVTVSIPASSTGSAPVLAAAGLGGGAAGARSGDGRISIADNDAAVANNAVAACVTADVRSDVEGYAAETGNGQPHVDRWQRVLDAFDGKAGGMTAAEARQMAAQYWAVRWDPVAEALECIENASGPEVTVTAGNAISEGGDAAFTVKADPAPASKLTVTLTVDDDAAGDFLAQDKQGTQTVVINANQTTATLTLATTPDGTDEPDGAVTATVANGAGYTAGTSSSATVVVSDDDATVVTLTVPDAAAAEGDAADGAEISLTLGRGLVNGEVLAAPLLFAGGAPGQLFTLACPQAPPAGVSCQDLGTANPKVTFTGPASGASATTVALSLAAGDDTDSDDETVTVSIPASSTGSAPVLAATGLGGGATGARTGDGRISIADNDAPPVNPYAALIAKMYEWRNDPQWKSHKSHTDRWDRALLAFGESVSDVSLTPMTAAEAQAFADRGMTRWVEVAAALHEIESGATGPAVTVTGGNGVTEGGDAVFTVHASPAPASSLTVTLTVDDDATSDFLAQGDEGSNTVTISANQGSATLTLATVPDSNDEPDGVVTATVANRPGYSVGSPDKATVAVSDDDTATVPTLSVAIAPASANEGGAGGKAYATVTFGLDPARAQPTAFKACLADTGTAVRGDDYLFVGAGSDTPLGLTGECHDYTIAANAASGEARLLVRGDTAFEPDETVTVELKDPPQGVVVSGVSGTATHTILNDDAAPAMPVLSLSAGAAVDEGGKAGFTIHADAPPQADLAVELTVAQSGDYLDAPGAGSRTVTLAAGATAVALALATDDDAVDEADGSVSVTLETGNGYTVAASPDDTATVAVADNDVPVVSIAAGAGVTEGDPASFTVTANPTPAAPLTVALTVGQSGDYAAAGQTGSREVVVPTGGSVTVEVATDDDKADEPDGSVTATLAAGNGYTVAASPDDTASVAVADNDEAAGVPSLSVVDGEANENGGRLPVVIRLSPPSKGKVTVWARTRESNPVSARAGVDYRVWNARWGIRIDFRPGETERRLAVGLVNDSHDEDAETFEVVLSDPTGGAAIADGVGTMTIVNSDPMPAAWLARFGRTVAEQALDGIAGRMAAPRTAGAHGTIAGQALGFGTGGPDGTAGAANDNALLGGSSDSLSLAQSDIARAFGASADRLGSGHGPDHGLGLGDSRTVTSHELLLGSSFTATGEKDGSGGSLAFWGRAAQSSFDGREGTFSLDGETATAMLGADYARGNWLAGLALMQSSGEGGYADSGTGQCPDMADMDSAMRAYLCDGAVREGDGKVEASLTAAVPYAAIQASERLRLWGALGYGTGEVTLKPTMGGALKSDIAWTMASAGLRGELLPPPKEGSGPALALTSDALWARTSSEKTSELAASDSDVTRLRLGLEGSWKVALEDGGHLTPKLEIGARHDGGDAETGFGVELGGGLAWMDPRLGLSLDLSGRTLVSHASDDLEDRGFAASLAFDPDPATKRGPSLTLRQDWGGQAQGGLDALFAPETLDRRSGGGEATSRWQAEAAWGFPAFSGRFTGSPHVGIGLATAARDYSLGWRLTPAAYANAPDVSFGVRATRRESDGSVPEHTVGFEVNARW